MKRIILLLALAIPCITLANTSKTHTPLVTSSIQKQLTPNQVLARLKAGNQRFLKGKRLQGNLIKKAQLTAKGQHPAAVILSCIDSRVPPELVFDQGVGNVFVTRVAANVLNKDVLAGLEFATKVSGAKLIVVMGHDSCGAVKGACNNVKLGHITGLLHKIQPAVKQATKQNGTKNCSNSKFINTIAKDNVINVVKAIPQDSPIIANLIKSGKVKIIGAMYHLNTGKVTFFN